MTQVLKHSARVVAAYVLAYSFIIPSDLRAQNHVVSPTDLQQEVRAASQSRERNLSSVRQFLSSPRAEKAIKSANIDPAQVKTAVAALSDEDLARLAVRADKAQADFAAGTLGERDLLLIIVAIAVLILIIVAVR